MKFSLLFLLAATSTGAFQNGVQHARRIAAAAPLQMGGFWDNPFHGGGSADSSELDEMYEEQQAILRRRQGLDTAPAVKRPRKQTKKVAVVKASKPPTQQHMDDTYAEDLPFKMPSMPKMPWDK